MSHAEDKEHAEFFEKQGEMLDRACRALAGKFAELWSSVAKRERAAFEAGWETGLNAGEYDYDGDKAWSRYKNDKSNGSET